MVVSVVICAISVNNDVRCQMQPLCFKLQVPNPCLEVIRHFFGQISVNNDAVVKEVKDS